MPKKRVPDRRSRQTVSRAPQRTGLIANAETRKRSVRTKSALDNRSHRTPEFSREAARARRECSKLVGRLVGCNACWTARRQRVARARAQRPVHALGARVGGRLGRATRWG